MVFKVGQKAGQYNPRALDLDIGKNDLNNEFGKILAKTFQIIAPTDIWCPE